MKNKLDQSITAVPRDSCARRIKLGVIAAALLGAASLSAIAGDLPLPPHSSAFGRSLEDWQDTYWRWALGEVTIKPDANGNAVAKGNVALMPLPAADGSGAPGSIDVTLNSGQSFMLPLLMVLGNSYSDGSVDALVSSNDFQDIDLSLKLDGVEIVNGTNAIQFYTQALFDPPISISGNPPVTAWAWFQGVGIVHAPLAPGSHTLTLDTRNTYPEYSFSVEYHNTWNVTVLAGK
jgi:hypothetical protein